MIAVATPGGLVDVIGQSVTADGWFAVEQDRIDAFADTTDDHQWIHVDTERAAKESPYGTTVAHGDLTLSLIEHLRPQLIRNTGVKMGINYGFDKVRFPAAVPAGSRIRASAEVVSVKELGDGWWHVVTKFTVEGEGQDKPVCVAESVGRALIG